MKTYDNTYAELVEFKDQAVDVRASDVVHSVLQLVPPLVRPNLVDLNRLGTVFPGVFLDAWAERVAKVWPWMAVHGEHLSRFEHRLQIAQVEQASSAIKRQNDASARTHTLENCGRKQGSIGS